MGIAKTDSSGPVRTRERFTYNLTIRNNGGTQCVVVEVTDELPQGVTNIKPFAFAFLGYTLKGPTVTCGFGTMKPGDNGSITIDVGAPITSGTITNQARVSTTSNDPNPANEKASEATIVLPEDRDVVFIQGLDSKSSCNDNNNNGLPGDFVESVSWIKS